MRRLPFALGLSALLLCACGGAQKDVDGLRQELARMQRANDDLERRVGILEAHSDPQNTENSGDSSSSSSAASSGTSEPKGLKVVKLEPAAAGTSTATSAPPPMVSAPIDDDSPRPMLKIGPDGMSETYPDDAKVDAKPKIDPKAVKEYDAALGLFKAKKFQKALDAFAGFVVRWPDHPYVGNALFWRGECYFSLGDFTAAESQLEGMIATHATSAKLPDALLKLGLTEKKLGSAAKAKAAFTRLRKEFPSSEAAKKIPPEDAS